MLPFTHSQTLKLKALNQLSLLPQILAYITHLPSSNHVPGIEVNASHITSHISNIRGEWNIFESSSIWYAVP